MLALRRILFPTDFSDGAVLAFPQAAALAAWHDAELHVLNVTERAAPPEETLPASLEVLRGWLGHASDAGPTDDLDLEALSLVQNQVDDDSAAERIVAYAEAEGIDLIVMSTHGRRGVQRMLLGSVTEEVVRTAPCPVLAVRSDGDEAPSPIVRRILVPVDFSDASRAAVRHANALAQTYGAEIDLLHVVEQVVYPSAYGVEPAYFPTQEVLARVERTLGEMAREGLDPEHVSVSAVVGYAPMSILDHADEHDIDLIVIATHGRSGLDRMLLGSVAERVLRRAPTPVFIVKPDRASLVSPAASEAAATSS